VIATLVDPSQLQINATVDQASIQQVKAGQPVSVTFDGFPDRQFQGTVAAVTPAGTSVQGTARFPVTVTFDAAGETIPPGTTAALRITTSNPNDAVTVPSNAVQQHDGSQTVTVLLPGGGTETRTVTVASTGDAGTTAILSGIRAGERVEVPGPVPTPSGSPAAQPSGQ
jgi:multidrug efflux pump subunit AcrA (membrane-fusion protein)